MKKYIKYLSLLAGAILLGGSLTSCVDDALVEGNGAEDIYSVAEDEYAMGVVLSLGQLSNGTRALDNMNDRELKDIEEYVNTENLYILFFNLDGIFLFQIDKPVAIPIGQSTLGNDSQWFIKIPVKDINPNLIKYIEENPFKIAVLANWTFDSDRNLGEDLGGWEEFRFNQPVDEKGNLTYDAYGKLIGDHISLLAHAQRDNTYENTTNHGYDHLTFRTENGKPHMGPYTEWVHNYHSSIKEAELQIRSYYDVKNATYSNSHRYSADDNKNNLGRFEMKYNNLWHLWNFGSADKVNTTNFPSIGDDQAKVWIELNDQARKEFLKNYNPLDRTSVWKFDGYQGIELSYGVLPMTKTSGEIPTENSELESLLIVTPNMEWKDYQAGNPINIDSRPSVGAHPFIHFKAPADGYLRVNYEAYNGAKLIAHIGSNNTPTNNAQHYQRDNLKSREECTVGDDGQFGDVPFDPEDVYLFMVVDPDEMYVPETPEESDGDQGDDSDPAEGEEEENPELKPVVPANPYVKIYSIEYIESRHLYDVDRYGVLPSKDDPIPMYGIQDFDPIGEYWQPGILFNLSQLNNAQKEGYIYRTISLLRSLSRVEVRLLKSQFPQKPSHVFMRSMNRSARMTPVDFFTPTDIIWNGFNENSVSDVRRRQNYIDVGNLSEQHILEKTPGVQKEEKNIMGFGPFYIGSNTVQTGNILNEYRSATAWPFGIWEQQWEWNWNRGTGFVDNFATYEPGDSRNYTGQTVPEYPRILHTRISRSDYARMTEVDDPLYWHYIMYIPEKNITDADNPGDLSDRPKIIHVELRFNGGPEGSDPEDNQVDNFDDKEAYRLYFTEGGRANLGNFDFTGRGSWDAYEYDLDIVKQHWPILRNHVYTFTVNGIPTYKENVIFQAESPDYRGTSWNFN